MHLEIGHLKLPHDLARDPFPGACPFHGDCLEGLASGPAMQARWGAPAGTLPPDHPAWALEAHYLALGLWNLTLALSPRRILLGGGVMQQAHLFPLIRTEFSRIANRYIQRPEIVDGLDEYIQAAATGQPSGRFGNAGSGCAGACRNAIINLLADAEGGESLVGGSPYSRRRDARKRAAAFQAQGPARGHCEGDQAAFVLPETR